MKKGILISGIIWGVLCVLGFLPLLIVGLAATSPEVINELVAQGTPRADAEAAAAVTCVTMVIWAFYLLIGGVFSFIFVGLRNSKMGKGGGIALGVVGALFGATLPGVLFIVDSAMNR